MNDLLKRLFRKTKANDTKVANIEKRTVVLENRPKITGMDIYIQANRPEVAGVFVWIDTTNIDVLQ